MPFVSAGVYVRELDFSDYVPALSSTILGLLGGATKGKLNTPTLITNENELVNVFGKPTTDDYGLQSAVHYLKQGRQLMFSRVADSDVDTAHRMVKDSAAASVFEVFAASPGSWGNGISIDVANGSGTGLYNIVVNAVVDQSGALAVVEKYLDVSLSSTNARFIETVINDGIVGETSPSRYITVTLSDGTKIPVVGNYALLEGADGISGLSAADYIGTVTGQTATGLKALANPERYNLNLLAIPGVSDPSVVNEMIATARGRADTLALVDSPFGLDVGGVVDWHNGEGYGHDAFNDSFGALYWPWVKVYDAYNKKEAFMPPSGFVTAQMAYNDYVADPWFAAAGFSRGLIRAGVELEMSPDLGQRDALYGDGNAVNPIVNFTREGITIWGDRTLQRRPTALDRVNVRRMLLYVEKVIATSVRYLVFEPNDPTTWRRFVGLVTPSLEFVKARRGLYDYRVICDETTNPAYLIDQNHMNGRLLLKPTKNAEVITIDFVVLSTGAKFSEQI